MPIRAGWPLVHGNIVHTALEEFAKSGHCDLKSVQQKVKEQAALSGFDVIGQRDWAALVTGQLLGFMKCVWPALMAEYEVVDTEKWIEYDCPGGFRFRARQDLLLRNKFDNHLAYIDYKNTSSNQPQWIKSWAKSVQLHSSMYAMRKSMEIDIQRAIVIGLYKGYNDKKNNIQRSVFNYGYVNREFQMSPEYSYEYKRSRGWEMFSTIDEFDGDLSNWVDGMATPLLTEQFPMTGPIFPRDDIAEKWFRQQLIREAEVADAMQLLQTATDIETIQRVLDKYFRQNFSHCDPSYGYSCEFKELCWQPWVEADPLGSGLFKRHEYEFEVE